MPSTTILSAITPSVIPADDSVLSQCSDTEFSFAAGLVHNEGVDKLRRRLQLSETEFWRMRSLTRVRRLMDFMKACNYEDLQAQVAQFVPDAVDKLQQISSESLDLAVATRASDALIKLYLHLTEAGAKQRELEKIKGDLEKQLGIH
jgi:hypothetical protein